MYECRYQPFIQTKYIGPTNFRPSRVRAVNVTSGERVLVSWDHALGTVENHIQAARLLLAKLGKEAPAKWLACGTDDSSGYVLTALL